MGVSCGGDMGEPSQNGQEGSGDTEEQQGVPQC